MDGRNTSDREEIVDTRDMRHKDFVYCMMNEAMEDEKQVVSRGSSSERVSLKEGQKD